LSVICPMQRREKTIDPNSFERRHIGPNENEVRVMLREVGFEDLDSLVEAAVPKNIRFDRELDLPEPKSETEALAELRGISRKNKIARSFVGCGYSDCVTPPVIQRNILENPGWYTAYTPYQAELAQGRLEALLNFQTMITDLTGLEIANASLLDEATAAAEAMTLCHAVVPNRKTFFVADDCHPQTIAVVQTRAKPLGIEIKIGDYSRFQFDDAIFGALIQYPATDGAINSGVTCPAGSLGCHTTLKAGRLTALRCKRESNTSVAIKRRATSARRRFFLLRSHQCMRFIMGRKDCVLSPSAFIA